jgi:hypothetical protein
MKTLFYLFILFYLLVSPYYNTQNYNKNMKNNIHDYRQGDRNSVHEPITAGPNQQLLYKPSDNFFVVPCLVFKIFWPKTVCCPAILVL